VVPDREEYSVEEAVVDTGIGVTEAGPGMGMGIPVRLVRDEEGGLGVT
jgi:hypothetical protein